MADSLTPERRQTLRDALYFALKRGPFTLRELSTEVGASEKDLPDHLEHLARSLDGSDEQLEITAARCIACGFEFADRKRLSKPGRCPQCRSSRIAPPRYSLA